MVHIFMNILMTRVRVGKALLQNIILNKCYQV